MILLIMGVCGSGKTTVGNKLAEKLQWSFADADGFHSESNRQKMSRGTPLTDEDRQPWLLSIHTYMQGLVNDRKSGIVTCSALKSSYRHALQFGAMDKLNKTNVTVIENSTPRESLTKVNSVAKIKPTNEEDIIKGENSDIEQEVCLSRSLKQEIRFIHLTGSQQTLQQRMESRQGHFMPATLLESQLHTLEPLDDNEPGIVVDIDKDVDDLVNDIIDRLAIVKR